MGPPPSAFNCQTNWLYSDTFRLHLVSTIMYANVCDDQQVTTSFTLVLAAKRTHGHGGMLGLWVMFTAHEPCALSLVYNWGDLYLGFINIFLQCCRSISPTLLLIDCRLCQLNYLLMLFAVFYFIPSVCGLFVCLFFTFFPWRLVTSLYQQTRSKTHVVK